MSLRSTAFHALKAACGPLRERPPAVMLPTGMPELDALLGGLPRGAITEICGPASSGRTTLLVAALAAATARQEVCAVVDTHDRLDPRSASTAGADLERLLWVRCGANVNHALKAADLLLAAGGFGLVALDLGEIPHRLARRIPLASWFRFRRTVENTPTALVVLAQAPVAGSCASLVLELSRQSESWSGGLLRGLSMKVERRKPGRAVEAVVDVCLSAQL